MKSTRNRALALYVAVAATGQAGVALAQTPPPAPITNRMYDRLQSQPDALRALTHPAARPAAAETPPPAGSPWAKLTNSLPLAAGAMFALTDGTVIVQDQGACNCGSGNWWRFSPDILGSYLNGTWSQIASMPSGYAPQYYASGLLPDGRLIVEGGEYNGGDLVWTNQGAIYDPVANTWTNVLPPTGSQWSRIGDAPGAVLSNGVFMLGASGFSGTTAQAKLNPATLGWVATGSGKADGNGEEGWTLLPSGKLLTTDTTVFLGSELYSPATGAWTSAGSVPANLIADGEIGPQLLIPNGKVLSVGATGANAVYTASTGVWSAAPSFPVIGGLQYDSADGPAAILPNGSMLIMASPGTYQIPSHFFKYNGTSLVQIADAPNSANLSSFYGFMLVLPTGQVMFNSRFGEIDLYTDSGAPNPRIAPTVTAVPLTLSPGASYSLSGKQLSGLTTGSAYGDDYEPNTNFPLVRIVNNATSHVFYARTSGHAYVGVKPGVASSTTFKVAAGTELGASKLYAVANGIASPPVAVTIVPGAVAEAR